MPNFDRIYLYVIFFCFKMYYIYKVLQVFFHFVAKNRKYTFFTGIPSLLFLQQFKQTSRIFQNVFLIMHKKTDRKYPVCFFIIQSI